MKYLINIFITTSVTAIIILGARRLLEDKISPRWKFVLWAILGVRLLMPILPESNLSIFNSMPRVENIEVETQTSRTSDLPFEGEDLPARKASVDSKPYIKGNISAGERAREITVSKGFADTVVVVWLIGVTTLFIYFMAVYLIFHLKTRKLVIAEDAEILSILEECKEMSGVKADIVVRWGGKTPTLKGFSNPQIILPKGYTDKELRGIFIHELMHYKHGDTLWNIIGTFLLCLYWYNPLIWLSFSKFREDTEILCDYRVLKVYDDRRGYASVLMKTALAENTFIMATTSMQNGEKHISKRVKKIAYFKKPSVIWSSIGVLIAIIIVAVCLTNPIGNAGDRDINRADQLDYEEIYRHRTLYVGDASKVGNLTSSIYYSEFRDGISLKTDKEPYGVTVNYSRIPGQNEDNIVVTDDMLKNAAIMFCLIDNVDEINFMFNYGGTSNTLSFERESFNEIMGEDIRQYASSFEKFKDEFIPMIEKEDWSVTRQNEEELSEIGSEIEELLQIIMSSPRSSSNPKDYIEAHQYEYETILKMGDRALDYMLSRFEKGEDEGLKAHIMMSLCIDLLGDKNNVLEGSYTSPKEWYSRLSPYEAVKLPSFEYETEDKIEGLVYEAALRQYSQNKDGAAVTIVAPRIFGTYEANNELKIFTTVYYQEYILYGKTLSSNGGGIIPGAIIYTKNEDGTYSLKEYIQAMDGSYFKKSIEDFCHPRDDIAKEILNHYSNYEDLFELMKKNLINYLNANKMKDINLKEYGKEIIPLT